MGAKTPSINPEETLDQSTAETPEKNLRETAGEAIQDYNEIVAKSGYKSGKDLSEKSNDELNDINAMGVNDKLLELAARGGLAKKALEHCNNFKDIFAPGTDRDINKIKTDPENINNFKRDLSGEHVLRAIETALQLGGKDEECFRVLFDKDGINQNLLPTMLKEIELGNVPPNFLDGEPARPTAEVVRELAEIKEKISTTDDPNKIEELSDEGGNANVDLLQSLTNGDNKKLRDLTISGLEAFLEERLGKIEKIITNFPDAIKKDEKEYYTRHSTVNTNTRRSMKKKLVDSKKRLEEAQSQKENLISFSNNLTTRPRTIITGQESLPGTFGPRTDN